MKNEKCSCDEFEERKIEEVISYNNALSEKIQEIKNCMEAINSINYHKIIEDSAFVLDYYKRIKKDNDIIKENLCIGVYNNGRTLSHDVEELKQLNDKLYCYSSEISKFQEGLTKSITDIEKECLVDKKKYKIAEVVALAGGGASLGASLGGILVNSIANLTKVGGEFSAILAVAGAVIGYSVSRLARK